MSTTPDPTPLTDAPHDDGTTTLSAPTALDRTDGAPRRSWWSAFRTWTRGRPFVGGLLVLIAGVELFLSGQLDFGHIHLQFGVQGMQAMIIPIVLALLGVLIWTMPVHRVFYGVIALVLSLYALVGVNLGGFLIGMVLGIVGAIVSLSWLPRDAAAEAVGGAAATGSASPDSGTAEPEDDYSLVPGFADAAVTPAVAPTEADAATPAETEPLVPVAAAAEPSSPATLTLHTAETAAEDTSSGPRPFLDASADPDAAPDPSPAPATSRRGRRLTRATGAAVVAVCAAAGVGVVNAAQASTATAATQASVPVPTFLQWLIPGSDDASSTPSAEPTETATAGAATSTPSGTSATAAGAAPTATAPAGDPAPGATSDGKAATDPSTSASPSATSSPDPTPTSPLPAATTPAPKLAATSSAPVAPALVSHLEGSTLQLTNAHFVGNTTLQRADGSSVEVMKFTTDKTVIDDFSLDVPNGDGHGLLTTADKVTNTGHVVLYATRLEGHLLGFKLTFKPETPPPGIIPLPSLSDPSIELVATTSDASSWSNTHQKLY